MTEIVSSINPNVFGNGYKSSETFTQKILHLYILLVSTTQNMICCSEHNVQSTLTLATRMASSARNCRYFMQVLCGKSNAFFS